MTDAALPALAEAMRGNGAEDACRWRRWVSFVYGALDGQRGVDHQALAGAMGVRDGVFDTVDLVVAIHLRAGVTANVLSQVLGSGDLKGALEGLAGEVDARSYLLRVGRSPSALHPELLPHVFIVEDLDDDGARALLAFVRSSVASMLQEREEGRTWERVSTLYLDAMPKNALHALGEFYTPPWLAGLMLQRVGWTSGERLIDPFVGPGALLCAALRKVREDGGDPLAVLPDLTGLDINPTSCAIARASLLLEVLPEIRGGAQVKAVNVLHADAILPSLLQAEQAPGSPAPTMLGEAGSGFSSEQVAALAVRPADVMVTNPPWVGWEYQSRAMRAHLQPAWEHYDLYHRGRHHSFLKEDLSSVATVSVLDTYLREGGRAAVLLPAAALKSSLASGGLRRLRVFEDRGPLELRRIELFEELRVFPTAQIEAMAWILSKGRPTSFPVPVYRWARTRRRWQPDLSTSMGVIAATTRTQRHCATPSDTSQPRSRWMVGDPQLLAVAEQLRGEMPYRARSGVFTGGANAVYYVERVGSVGDGVSMFCNVVGGAKRAAPLVTVPLEEALVYSILRGRDVRTWCVLGGASILCPHTAATRMRPIPMETLKERFPHALTYLEGMRPVLDARRGFAKWELKYQAAAFYTMQRIGDYTFSPYKVVWRYIASDFVVAAVGMDERGMPWLANDKVVSIAVRSEEEAYYLAGVLSSTPIRWQVLSQTSGRQISTSAVANLAVPLFQPGDPVHEGIADVCRQGHELRAADAEASIESLIRRVDVAVCELLGVPVTGLAAFVRETPVVR